MITMKVLTIQAAACLRIEADTVRLEVGTAFTMSTDFAALARAVQNAEYSNPPEGVSLTRAIAVQMHTALLSLETSPWDAYCTQECLKGLATTGKLDPICPNLPHHIPTDIGLNTPVDIHEYGTVGFVKALQSQIENKKLTLEDGIEVLVRGSKSIIYQITEQRFGYTVIAKGVTPERDIDLVEEQQVYDQLTPLQGKFVPVCLGSFRLRRALPDGTSSMLLLSWSGETDPPQPNAAPEWDVLNELENRRVVFDDNKKVQYLNMPGRQNAFVVDLESARVLTICEMLDRIEEQVDKDRAANGGTLPEDDLEWEYFPSCD
jgi:hypothetical protein